MSIFPKRKTANDKFIELGFKLDPSPPENIIYKRDYAIPTYEEASGTEVIRFCKNKDGWKCDTWRDVNLTYHGTKCIHNKEKSYTLSETFKLSSAPDDSTFDAMCELLHELKIKDKRKR